MRFSAPSKGQGSQYARSGRHTACLLSAGGGTHMSTARDKRQRQIAVTGAIGHEHFMAGVRMLYACRYRDAVNHFQEAIMLEPQAKGYLSYLGLALAPAEPDQRERAEPHRGQREDPPEIPVAVPPQARRESPAREHPPEKLEPVGEGQEEREVERPPRKHVQGEDRAAEQEEEPAQ